MIPEAETTHVSSTTETNRDNKKQEIKQGEQNKTKKDGIQEIATSRETQRERTMRHHESFTWDAKTQEEMSTPIHLLPKIKFCKNKRRAFYKVYHFWPHLRGIEPGETQKQTKKRSHTRTGKNRRECFRCQHIDSQPHTKKGARPVTRDTAILRTALPGISKKRAKNRWRQELQQYEKAQIDERKRTQIRDDASTPTRSSTTKSTSLEKTRGIPG